MCCEPLRGWRHVRVTARRTRQDWAECIRELADVSYPKPPAFVWCSIISTPIQERLYMRRFRHRKPDGYWTVWSFTTPPSMPVGSTWRKSQSAFYRVNASIAVWTTPIGCAARSVPGKNGATNDRSKSIGVLPLLLLGINSTNSIRSLTTVNRPGEKEPVNRRLSTY